MVVKLGELAGAVTAVKTSSENAKFGSGGAGDESRMQAHTWGRSPTLPTYNAASRLILGGLSCP